MPLYPERWSSILCNGKYPTVTWTDQFRNAAVSVERLVRQLGITVGYNSWTSQLDITAAYQSSQFRSVMINCFCYSAASCYIRSRCVTSSYSGSYICVSVRDLIRGSLDVEPHSKLLRQLQTAVIIIVNNTETAKWRPYHYANGCTRTEPLYAPAHTKTRTQNRPLPRNRDRQAHRRAD